MLPPGGRAIREPLPETIMVWRSRPFANIASCGGGSKKGARHGRRPLHQDKPPIDKLSRAFTARAGPEANGKQECLCYLEEFAALNRCLPAGTGSSSAACAIFRVRFEAATDDRETNSPSKTHFVPVIRGSRETRTR